MLKGHLPELLVPLRCLEVFCCNQLEAYTISALQVQLRDYGKLQLDGTTIKFQFKEDNIVFLLKLLFQHLVRKEVPYRWELT